MGLRRKTILVIVATMLAVALSVIFLFRVFYLDAGERFERREAEDALRRFSALVADDLDQLDVICKDWAFWDDSYEFASGRNPRYVESNLDNSGGFGNLDLSALLIRGSSDKLLFAFAEKPGLAEVLVGDIERRGSAFRGEGGVGLAIFGADIHLVSVRPILRNDRSGPSPGMLVMARLVDGERLDRYARLLGRRGSLEGLPATGETALGDPTNALGLVQLRRLGSVLIASTDLLDLSGLLSVRLRLDLPQGEVLPAGSRAPIFIMLLAGLIAAAGMLSVLVLESSLLGRMGRIRADLDRVIASGDLGARVSVSGSDELSVLCSVFNGTLDSLGKAITERDAMLREVHHRVKNNLQVIASILSLQSSAAADEAVASALGRSRLRVMVISLVHEDLFARPSLDRIDLRSLLEKLVSGVAQFEEGYAGRCIDASIECGAVEIDIDQAMPVALAVTEAIANVYGHAYPGREVGTMRVAAAGLPGGGFVVEIEDEGVGMELQPLPQRGIGLGLMEALAFQLRGSCGFSKGQGGGTKVRIEAPGEDSSLASGAAPHQRL